MKKTLSNVLPLIFLLIAAACGGEAPEAVDHNGVAHGEAQAETVPAPGRAGDVQVIEIEAGDTGYSPSQIDLQEGMPVRLVFTRTTDAACLEQVRIPAFGIDKTNLPKGEPVVIEFTPQESGTFTFACGMNMVHGTLVVKA